MKKSFSIILVAGLLVLAAFVNPVKAQNHKKEMAKFAKDYQNAYNKKDVKALQQFYTADAVEINIDGTTINGNEAIGASMTDQFKRVSDKIKITPDNSVSNSDGSVTGTGSYYVYHLTGTSEKDEQIDGGGNFTNTIVKENGHWKISKSVLSKSKTETNN